MLLLIIKKELASVPLQKLVSCKGRGQIEYILYEELIEPYHRLSFNEGSTYWKSVFLYLDSGEIMNGLKVNGGALKEGKYLSLQDWSKDEVWLHIDG